MSEIIGGILSAAPPGVNEFDRRTAHFLADPRARDVDPEHIRRQAGYDEEAGYDRSLIHIYSAWGDPWLIAAHAATATSRTGLTVAHRPGVVAPTVAARSFATLDNLSGGRAAVHIVVGSSDVDVRRDGDFLGKAQRYDRALEYLELFVKSLTAPEPFDYQGKWYQVEDAWAGFCPVQQPFPPISIGGSSPEAKVLAARFGYAYAGTFPSLEAAGVITSEVDALAAEYGRELRYWKQFFVILGDTDHEAHDAARAFRSRGAELLLLRSNEVLGSSAQLARNRERDLRHVADTRDAALRHLDATFDGLVVGSVATVAEHIDGYRRAGINIVQVVALTETEEDRKLRSRLIAELRR
ncbi:LLM class flavin-dependent oxidoreductase [Mycobacteroides franklinii]|uniref:LLM class flavin-dependent oxidoreductase n=1 Tax=Mycobacteroides franklinii TaxID=948102 RepID=UPI000993B30C|nr:LLM class flavin-dependent oxidoreductase [Mycobacteroides franklinii]